MKKFLSLILCLATALSVAFVTSCSADEKTLDDIFKKDNVIDVKIEMDDSDLSDMRKNAKDEKYHPADVTVDGVKVENAGIRTKGNMTLNSVANSDSDRYSYRIKFNKYTKGNKLLGLDELCLNNGYSDPSYMREYLHYEVLRELGMNVPDAVFCNVYINGEYAGFYLAVEGLGKTFLKENFSDYKDGNFYKMDEGATLEYKENEDYSYADLKSGGDDGLTSFKKFVKDLNTAEADSIGDFLDVDSALKYIASNTVLCNYDSYNGNMHHNYYLYENKDGVFTVVPWDFNMSFGGFDGDSSTVGIDTPYTSGSAETLPLIGRLLSVPEYKEKYYGYIEQICDILKDFDSRVTQLKEKISKYVKADTTAFYSYDEFDRATSENSQDTSSDGGRPFGKSNSIVDCVSKRLENIKNQFDGTAEKTTQASEDRFGRGAPPQMKDGEEPNGAPPQMKDGEKPDGAPPQMKDGEKPNGEPPQMKDGEKPNGAPPQMKNGEKPNGTPSE